MVIFADAMKVEYESKGKLKEIQAQGGVKIIQGDRIATGDLITFYNEQQKIVLTGNPRVWQGDNVITGEKITVYIKEERSVVEGSQAGRVSATIVPRKKEQKTFRNGRPDSACPAPARKNFFLQFEMCYTYKLLIES